MSSRATRRKALPAAASCLLGVAMLMLAAPAGAAPTSLFGDTVVVVVSSRSNITEISKIHLADLYMGRTTRFPDGQPAEPVDQRAGSSVRAAFLAEYLDRTESQMKSHWSRLIFTGRGRPPRELGGGEAVRELVARDTRAIGYVDARLVDGSLRRVRIR